MSHRTQITVTDEQYERLLGEAQRSGLSVAELVRRALDRAYGTALPDDIVRAIDESFGCWTEREYDGAAYVDERRSGLARRLNTQ